jgi:hypothetical protein
MRLFVVMLALAVAASTQTMAFEPQRHARMTRKAEVDRGCDTHYHRGVSGACVRNPTDGPYRPDPCWMPCDYSSVEYPEGYGD